MRDLFDFHAAGLRGHEDHLRTRAVEHNAQIQLAGDSRAGFNQQPLHSLPGGAGLVRHQLHAENLLRVLFRFAPRLCQLHAAALAATPGVDLRLHHHDPMPGAEELLRRGVCLLKGGRHLPVRDRHTVAAQNLFRLVLVNLHEAPSKVRQTCSVSQPMVARRVNSGKRRCAITDAYDRKAGAGVVLPLEGSGGGFVRL